MAANSGNPGPERFEGLNGLRVVLNALDQNAALMELGRKYPTALTAEIEPAFSATTNGSLNYRATVYFVPTEEEAAS